MRVAVLLQQSSSLITVQLENATSIRDALRGARFGDIEGVLVMISVCSSVMIRTYIVHLGKRRANCLYKSLLDSRPSRDLVPRLRGSNLLDRMNCTRRVVFLVIEGEGVAEEMHIAEGGGIPDHS